MIYSMTGYGRGQSAYEGKTITVELKSVNNRFLDCTVRCPRAYMFIEEPIKQAIKSSGVARGKIEVAVTIDYAGGDVSVSLNEAAAAGYVQAVALLSEKFGLENDMTAMNLACLPDVFSVAKSQENAEEFSAHALEALDIALKAFHEMRHSEGMRLVADIAQKGQTIRKMKDAVALRMPEIVTEYRRKLLEKMKEILADTASTEQRILAEAALFADKVATDEETVRLTSHLASLEEILASEGPVGRKLDFLVQEINREINTIGSKANDLTVTGLVLDMKCELEKIREQIQNLE